MYLLFGGKKIGKTIDDINAEMAYENNNKIVNNLIHFIKNLNPIDNFKIYKQNVATLGSGHLLDYNNIGNIIIFISLLYIFYSKSMLNIYVFILLYIIIYGVKNDKIDNFNKTIIIICLILLIINLIYLYINKKPKKKISKKEEEIIKIKSDRYFER